MKIKSDKKPRICFGFFFSFHFCSKQMKSDETVNKNGSFTCEELRRRGDSRKSEKAK